MNETPKGYEKLPLNQDRTYKTPPAPVSTALEPEDLMRIFKAAREDAESQLVAKLQMSRDQMVALNAMITTLEGLEYALKEFTRK